MDEDEKKALRTSVEELINQIQVNTTFQEALKRQGVFPPNVVDRLLRQPSGQAIIRQCFKELEKSEDVEAFGKFLDVLQEAGETDVVAMLKERLDGYRKARTSQLQTPQNENPRPNGVGASMSTADPAVANAPGRCEGSQAPKMSPRDVHELREALRKTRPSDSLEMGNIAVYDTYYQQVCKFVGRRPTTSPPPPVQEIDQRPKVLEGIAFLPPTCCAELTKACGGSVTLSLHSEGGHHVLRDRNGKAKYCKALMYLQPGNIRRRRTCWLSVEHALQDSLGEITTWQNFRAKFHRSDEEINVLMTGGQWQMRTDAMKIHILHPKICSTERSSTEEKRLLISRQMRGRGIVEELDVLVTASYYRDVETFASGKTDKEPGIVQVPGKEQLSLHLPNFKFLPPECCATLIELYGGEVHLLRTNERGPMNLLGMDLHTKYFSCSLYVRVEKDKADRQIGSFVFAGETTLENAISNAVAWVPIRGQTKGTTVDLDLRVTVREWFLNSSKSSVVVWRAE